MKARTCTMFLAAGLILGVLVMPTAVDAGALMSGPVGSGPFPIRAEAEQEVQPAVAYNPDRQEYLVVFWNDRPGNDDIRAERVSKDGKLLGGVWVAAGAGADRRYPDVTYNSQAQEYLVVWAAEDTGGNTYIRGQRLQGTDAQLQGGAIPIHAVSAASFESVTNPAVAYASTANDYLVVWEHELLTPPHRVHILGHIVSSNGTPSPSGFFFVSQDPGLKPRSYPDLAYNRHANGFLVVWQQWDGTASSDIYGQLVNGDGIIPPFLLPIKVADVAGHCKVPAVAAIPTAPGPYKYLVVYEITYSPGSSQDIECRLVEENGTPEPNPSIIICSEEATNPAVAGTEFGHRYLVTWEQWPLSGGDRRIHGWTISHAAWPLDQEANLPGVTADSPAVAAGPTGDFLVAWQDQPVGATNTNIYGQLWGNRVYLPLTLKNYK